MSSLAFSISALVIFESYIHSPIKKLHRCIFKNLINHKHNMIIRINHVKGITDQINLNKVLNPNPSGGRSITINIERKLDKAVEEVAKRCLRKPIPRVIGADGRDRRIGDGVLKWQEEKRESGSE